VSRKADLKKEFDDQRKVDAVLQECVGCGQNLYYRMMDRHHPAGKHGTNILRYVYLCRDCHREVHHDPKVATRRGLLWPGRNTRDITDPEWIILLSKIKENQHLS
jgi:hypothetical protein